MKTVDEGYNPEDVEAARWKLESETLVNVHSNTVPVADDNPDGEEFEVDIRCALTFTVNSLEEAQGILQAVAFGMKLDTATVATMPGGMKLWVDGEHFSIPVEVL